MGRRSGGYAGPNVSAGRLIVYERLLVTWLAKCEFRLENDA